MNARQLLYNLGFDAKKSLGQNFMVEEAGLRRMVEAAELSGEDAVLEVGPGLGALTDFLAHSARRVIGIEIDGRFIHHLWARYAEHPHVQIVHADMLQADVEALLGEDAAHYRVIANLPYYITSPILRYFLENPFPPDLLVVTVQYEVARRMAAKPGEMSLLAVGVQFYGMAEVVARLKPGHFYPPPKVESAIVRIRPHSAGPPVPLEWREWFFRIVRAGFSQPRKQIKNTLAAGLALPSEDVVNWLRAAFIAPERRAEDLSLAEWLALYQESWRVIGDGNPNAFNG